MAVVVINNASSLKVKLSCGMDGDGKAIVRSRTFSNLKHDANNEDVFAVANALMSLQEHDVMEVVKQDNTVLA